MNIFITNYAQTQKTVRLAVMGQREYEPAVVLLPVLADETGGGVDAHGLLLEEWDEAALLCTW